MKTVGNLIWFLFGGFPAGVSWIFSGILWCISIVGIPVGIQCFKFAALSFFPFGKKINYGGGAFSLAANIIWLIVSGIPMAAEFFAIGLVFCLTIIGIPFGKQMFKLAKLSLCPFGSTIEKC